MRRDGNALLSHIGKQGISLFLLLPLLCLPCPGRLGRGNRGNSGSCFWGFGQAKQPKGSRGGGELDDEIEGRGEVGNEVGDGVVGSQWVRFEETTH